MHSDLYGWYYEPFWNRRSTGTIGQENPTTATRQKSLFETQEMWIQNEYLGMIIEEGKISMDSVKLKGIQDWPVLNTVKEVWSFLGFGNYYWKFINKYSELALQWLKKLFQCLVNLTCKSNYERNTKAIILKVGTIV